MVHSRQELVIVDGIRTPFASANKELASLGADELGYLAASHLLARHPDIAAKIEEVIFGCVGPDAAVSNIARVIALRAGISEKVPALTVQRNCASGMEALSQVFHRADRNDDSAFLIGGTESMSNYPFCYSDEMKALFSTLGRSKSMTGKLSALLTFRPRFLKPRIALLEGLTDPICGLSMGKTAENLAREFSISRGAQDAYSLRSHQRAAASAEVLRKESFVTVTNNASVRDDTAVRPNQNRDALARLRPVFTRSYGTVTAGNSCAVTDGAVALLAASPKLMTEKHEALGYVRDCVTVGLSPQRMGLGPVFAISKLLERNQLQLGDIELFEINEAFAAQVLACLSASKSKDFCQRELGRSSAMGEIPLEQLNVNGGAIALGHPVGASGARIILTLLKEMKRRGAKRGIAALCVGGGQGSAVLLERMEDK
ncbi:MAG: acetyl-CoA C-acetyltransferase [Planctomycetota bacterium]|jgi:acetyl-CoA C-acetyltransferase